MHRIAALAVLLASPSLAQGPDCGSAAPLAGTGVHAFDLTGRAPAGPVGGGACSIDTGPGQGDVFWQWTCTTAGDFSFAIDTPELTSLIVYEGLGCGAPWRTNKSGTSYSVVVAERQPGDELLLHLAQNISSPAALGTLTIADVSDACSAATDDAYEDNDRYDTALPIGPGSYADLFVWRGDEDYFRVQVPADEAVRVDWQWAAGGVALRVMNGACGEFQFDESGSWVWTNSSGGPVELVLNFEMLQVGAACSTYDFELVIAPAPCVLGTDDAFEPNDTCALPAPIGAGAYVDLVTRDSGPDHYSIVVAPGDRLDVVGDSNAILVAMFDDSCTLLSEASRLNDYTNYGSNPETIVFRVRPNGFFSDGCEVYELSVGTAPDICASQPDDAFEDNDSQGSAFPLGDGFYSSLWVSIVDDDYFSACVAPGATFRAEICFPDNVVALDLDLLNAPGVQYDYFIDRVRATYTNQTAASVQVVMHVYVLPILTDCWWYDLEVLGSSSCLPNVTAFCLPGGDNSTGGPTTLEASFGSGVGSNLHLEAVGGPPGEFGYFLVSAGWVEPGGQLGDGRLCLTNPVGRYNGFDGGPAANSVGRFDATGRFENLSGTSTVGTGFDVPSYVPLIGATIAPGDSWSFQLWHRDLNPGPTVNFSTGVEVGF